MSSEDKKDRSHLPMPSAERTGPITYDAKDPDTKNPPIEQLRPPKGAPNVVIVLIDDAGFGSSSAFGGPCQTPNAERLAAGGLNFNRFHTTALCSPTRQALLTGRNHHSAGMGGITEIATGAPGYNSILPNTMALLSRTLKLNGYSTAQFGKCHEVPVWETSPVGPFDAWPTGGGGFEYFYGYLSVPTFLVDPTGTLLFYNEPAEVLLGRRFDETDAMPAEEWSTIFGPVDQDGQPIPPAELALMSGVLPTSGSSSGGRTASGVILKWWRFQYSEYKASFSVQSPCSGSSVNNARDAIRNSRLDTGAWA